MCCGRSLGYSEADRCLQLQKGSARPQLTHLILRSNKARTCRSSPNCLLPLRHSRECSVNSVALVGGEPITFHVNSAGEVDYLEVRPAPNGASAERVSPFTNWTTELSLNQIQVRLGRYARGIGPITNVRVAARGSSRRAIDLELVGQRAALSCAPAAASGPALVSRTAVCNRAEAGFRWRQLVLYLPDAAGVTAWGSARSEHMSSETRPHLFRDPTLRPTTQGSTC